MPDHRLAGRLTPVARLSLSNLAAQLSEQVALAAAPLVAVLLLGADAGATGMLQTAQTLPFLLLSIPVGLLVDRFARRRLMVGAELLRAAALGLVLGLLLTQRLTLESLALLGFIGAVGTVCYSVAAPALIPDLVERARLAGANRAQELGRSLAYAAGPAVGGAMVGILGGAATYALAAAISLLAAVMLARLPEPPVAARPHRNLRAELVEGLRFVARDSCLRPTLLTAIVFNTAWFVLQGVFVAYAALSLRLGPVAIGATMSLYGSGMIAGALLMPALSRRLAFGRTLLIGPFCGLAAAILILATLWLPSATIVGASFFLFGAGPTVWVIATMTLRQAVPPPAMLGRVSALIMTATFGARPLGAALGAYLALDYGIAAPLWAAAAGFLLQFAIIAAASVSRLAELPAPAEPSAPPAVRAPA